MVAYFYNSGPWRMTWVRFGFDPRKDPKARIYQTLDYRIRTAGRIISLVSIVREENKRITCRVKVWYNNLTLLLFDNVTEDDSDISDIFDLT